MNRYPSNVIDAFNIKSYNHATKNLDKIPLIILKFAYKILPDIVVIGPYNIKVELYSVTPKICKVCLQYEHSKVVCKDMDKAGKCFVCTLQLLKHNIAILHQTIRNITMSLFQ